jgi:SAM-dependent methyltransferase
LTSAAEQEQILRCSRRTGTAEGVDVSDDALAFVEKRAEGSKGLAESLPFADETFDLTTALDVVEHLDDDIAGLKEMYRVTKRGGYRSSLFRHLCGCGVFRMIFQTTAFRYTRSQIVERLKTAGYEIERATYANWTFFTPILAGRLLMKATGIKPESENNITISGLNGIFGKLFGAERFWLRNLDFPFGVSIVVVARKSAS